MNLQKSELKMLTAENIGRDLEKTRDKLERKIYRYQGGASALKEVEQLLNTITQQVRDEVVHGKDNKDLPYDPNNEIEVGKYIVSKFMEASKKIHHLVENASASAVRAEGEKVGMELAVQKVFGLFEEEKNKIEAIKESIANGSIRVEGDDIVLGDDFSGPRPPGFHPGLPLKAQRQAEEDEIEEIKDLDELVSED